MDSCQSEVCTIILNNVVPALGVLTVQFLTFSQWPKINEIRANKSLGNNSPFSSPSLAVNALAWLIYGLLIRDYYVFVSNISGFIFGLYFTMSCYLYADPRTQTKMDLMMGILFFVVIIGGLIAFIPLGASEQGKLLMGIVNVVILILFYVAPLSTMYEVIKAKNASGINLVMTIATFFNAGLWTIYGLVLGNIFIYLPNMLGVLCACMQCALLCVFPSKKKDIDDAPEMFYADSKEGPADALRLNVVNSGEGERWTEVK